MPRILSFTPDLHFLQESIVAVLSGRLATIVEVTYRSVSAESTGFVTRNLASCGGPAANISDVLELEDVLSGEGMHNVLCICIHMCLCVCVYCEKEHHR